jgi:hypothetical protein
MLTKDLFKYWYEKDNSDKNLTPLGYFELREINTITILPEGSYSKSNVMEIKVNNFFKKDKAKGERTFFFSNKDFHLIYEILISLNFLRVKSIYDNFTRQFGVIHLPMTHEIKISNKEKFKINRELEKMRNEAVRITQSNSNINSFRKTINKNNIEHKSSLSSRKRSSMNFNHFLSNKDENQKKNNNMKEDIHFIFLSGIITLFANIQTRTSINGDIQGDKLEDINFIKNIINNLCEQHQ